MKVSMVVFSSISSQTIITLPRECVNTMVAVACPSPNNTRIHARRAHEPPNTLKR